MIAKKSKKVSKPKKNTSKTMKQVKAPKKVLVRTKIKHKRVLIKKTKKVAIKQRKKVIASKVKKNASSKKIVAKKIANKKRVVATKKTTKKAVKRVILKNKKNKSLANKIKAIKPRKKVIAKKHKVIKEKISTFPAETLFKARIKVVGIGGGGGSIVSEIGRSLNKATFVIADTDIRALKKKSGIKYFWFGKEFTHGLGTGVNPEIAKEAAESEKEKITSLFKDQDIVILIASLGGGLGSGATQVFAEAAKSFGGITLGIFTLPFKFEGKNKSRIAQKALKELQNFLNVSITIPNERIFKIIDSKTSIAEAFSTVNKSLIESLESLIGLIYNHGLINIDFADLRTILNGNGNFAFLNTVRASGKNRAEETVEKIFTNPLYQNNNFIAEKILFNISGGANLNMFEVEKISKAIAESTPKAKIIFGISKNTKAKNSIKTTLLMTGPDKATNLIKEVVAEKKVVPDIQLADNKKQEQKKNKPIVNKNKKIKPARTVVPIFNKNQVIQPEREPAMAGQSGAVKKASVVEPVKIQNKKTIRRNALEIKKAEAIEEDKRLLQEEEWEVPAFLRRVKPSTK